MEEPLPAPPPRSSCRDGNAEEWAGFNAIVQVAMDQRKKGDEYHVAAATQWIGRMLADCFPERFVTAKPTPEAPPASSVEGADHGQ